jgi:hypothetical protein
MEKRERKKEELQYEGREKFELDVDRMLNEGMAGGAVSSEGNDQIGHAVDYPEEEPPRSSKHKH